MNDQPQGERLESWKKIAAYLKRDVRTVQRWEEANGLPIHRHQRAHRPIPYAYTSELDAWWIRQSQSSDPVATAEVPIHAPRRRRRLIVVVAALSLLVISGAYLAVVLLKTNAVSASAHSVAVLPFVDLSVGMANEEFADGISEEIIDRLNRIPGLKVPAPTSSFYYKNKQVPVREIGRSLDVAYVLDGSVRKAGDQVRVAVRLIRVSDAAVVWSETYDQTWSSMLVVQDDIAGAVTKRMESFVRASPL